SGSPRSTVAVDINPATRPVLTGTEIFTREVARRLPAAAPELRWRFFASRPRAGLGVDAMVLPFPRMWSQVRLPLALAAERPDLLFVPGHAVPFAWPGRLLTVVHDLAFERHPDVYRPAERAYLRLTTRWAAARCRLLIAVSESTRHDLVELYGVSPERVRVVPLGITTPRAAAAPASRLAELGLDGGFVLQVGRARDGAAGRGAAEAAGQGGEDARGDLYLGEDRRGGGGGRQGPPRPIASSIARQVSLPALSQLNWAARRMPRWRRSAARSVSSSTRSSALRQASTSPAGTTMPASPTTSGRLDVSATTTGVPQAMASSGRRPKPSYHAGCASALATL